MANGDGLPSLYPKIPTNIRLFMEQVIGKDSPITEQDFTEEELEVMRDRMMAQEARNIREEEGFRTAYERLNSPDYDLGWRMEQSPEAGRLEYVSTDILEAERQQELDRLKRGIESYETTRDRVSVPTPREKVQQEFQEMHGLKGGRGGWIDTLIESFSSPETNVSTTLGQFKAIKNEDDTVTIKDTYNWNPVGPDFKLSLKDFLTVVWDNRNDPEGLGNVFMRVALPKRERDVEINLPMTGED